MTKLKKTPIKGFLITVFLMSIACLYGGLFSETGTSLKTWMIPGTSVNIVFPGWEFFLLYVISFFIFICIFLLYPSKKSKTNSMITILFLSVLFRGLLFFHPISDDTNRYLWEGNLINHQINPYIYAPLAPELKKLVKNDPYYENINHPDLPSAYPPVVLYIFAGAAKITYSPYVLKIIMILFDLGAILFLMLLLIKRNLNLRWVLLYAINPLVLYSFAGQAHFDVMQLFFVTGALFFYDKKKWLFMFVFMGLAIQTKYIAIVGLPFLINKKNIKFLWAVFLTVILPYAPLYSNGMKHFFFSILTFGNEFAFNGSVHNVLRFIFGSMEPATYICKSLVIFSLLWGYYFFHPELNKKFREFPASGMFFSFGVLIIFAITIHFWYISWIVPFLVLIPKVSWIFLCLFMGFYFPVYGFQLHTGSFTLPAWMVMIEWIPFYILLVYDILRFKNHKKYKMADEPSETVSVVIPVYNEEKYIGACIDAVLKDKAVKEIIVVNGGSRDNTSEIAKKKGVIVMDRLNPLKNGGGRGGQIFAGILKASGDVVAILHADEVVENPVFTRMIHVLEKNPMIIGGAIGGCFFMADGIKYRIVEFMNRLRMIFFGISFGDQIQFFRRIPVIANNIYPNIPLMEDIEISIRLHSMGRQTFLFEDAKVSARRWKKKGGVNSIHVIKLSCKYLFLRMFGQPDVVAMYHDYYNHEKTNKK